MIAYDTPRNKYVLWGRVLHDPPPVGFCLKERSPYDLFQQIPLSVCFPRKPPAWLPRLSGLPCTMHTVISTTQPVWSLSIPGDGCRPSGAGAGVRGSHTLGAPAAVLLEQPRTLPGAKGEHTQLHVWSVRVLSRPL